MLAVLAAALVVAGCLSPSEPTAATRTSEFDTPVGSVRVRTVDDELRPVPGVHVRVVGSTANASTSNVGEAVLVGLKPGLHTVVVQHPRFFEKQRGVDVVADDLVSVEFRLEARPIPVYSVNTSLNFNGRIPVGAMVRTPDGARNEVLPGTSGSAFPETARLVNRFTVRLDQNWSSLTLEMTWQATTPAGTWLSLRVILPSTHTSDNCKFSHAYAEPEGTTPVKFRFDRAAYNAEVTPLTQNPRFCPAGDGLTLPIEVHPSSASPGAGAAADQGFTIRGAISYNGELPQGYTRLA